MHEFRGLLQEVRSQSFDGSRRRYHRFRHSTHDDAVVADCIGSNLRCAHEWGWCEGILDDPAAGTFYSPEDVIEELVGLADEHNCSSARITGMEPVMRDDHLIEVARGLDKNDMGLRIDTNGMLLDHEYLGRLGSACDLSIRLSFKGHDPASFQQLADVHGSWFMNQVRAFHACHTSDIETRYVLAGVFDAADRDRLADMLPADDPSIEVEKLRICPQNRERLEAAGFDLDHVLG
jgi:uncharacterized Fe-S cluster-containing radical SAM superfamily protein